MTYVHRCVSAVGRFFTFLHSRVRYLIKQMCFARSHSVYNIYTYIPSTYVHTYNQTQPKMLTFHQSGNFSPFDLNILLRGHIRYLLAVYCCYYMLLYIHSYQYTVNKSRFLGLVRVHACLRSSALSKRTQEKKSFLQ